jgi:8-oxo-dGTP pyrophosphatase MutT (NUDIX family)
LLDEEALMQPARVTYVEACDLTVSDETWVFARDNAAAIDVHWERATLANPSYFNGRIYVLAHSQLEDGVFSGQLIAAEFKAFLYWKETGQTDTSVCDVFGSALIRSGDGAILLGRQRAGNLNAGLVYLPGGFIDPRDRDDDGRVDIRGSVLREVEEETGLKARTLAVSDGFLITTVGQQVSIAVEIVGDGDADQMMAFMREAVAYEAAPELDEIVAVRTVADLDPLPMPEFAQVLLRHVLAGRVSVA